MIVHDSSIPAAVGLASNVGGFKTGQDAYQMALQADAARRANAAQAFHQQEAQDTGDESVYRTILQDMTARQLSQDRLQNQQDLLGVRGAQNLQGIYARGGIQEAIAGANLAGANQRATERNQTTADVAEANRASREGIAYSNQDLGYYNADQRASIAEQNRQARAELEQSKNEERQQLEQIKTSEQERRANQRLSVSAKRAMINAELQELAKLRGINEQRAKYNIDPNAPARIGQYNQAIQQKVMELGGLAPEQQQFTPPPGPQIDDPATFDQGMGLQGPPPQAQPQTGAPVQIQTQQDYDALPSGTPYIAPDGTIRQKQ